MILVMSEYLGSRIENTILTLLLGYHDQQKKQKNINIVELNLEFLQKISFVDQFKRGIL